MQWEIRIRGLHTGTVENFAGSAQGSGGIAPFIIKSQHKMVNLAHLSKHRIYLNESSNTAQSSHGSNSSHSVIFGEVRQPLYVVATN